MAIDNWNQAKQEAKNILIKRAELRSMITYSDLAGEITSIQFEAHDPRLFKLLADVSLDEDAEGRGMLSVIVVHKSGDKQPGDGFFELAEKLGRDTTETMNCWVKELKKVYAYWSNQ